VSVATAHKVFKASEAIQAALDAKRAARYATARYQPSEFLNHKGYEWQVVRVGEFGSGDLLYVLERVDLPGSRWTVAISEVR
jgi:hypothetical protein